MARPMPGELVSMLEETLLFRGLASPALQRITVELAVNTYQPGDVVCRQGEESDSLFIISEGVATVLVEDMQLGIEQEVTDLKAPDPFGEIDLVLGEPRNATVRARTELSCLQLSRNAFNMLLVDEPQIGIKISQNLARRLTEQTRSLTHKYVQLKDYAFDPELYQILPSALLAKHHAVPLEVDG